MIGDAQASLTDEILTIDLRPPATDPRSSTGERSLSPTRSPVG